MDIQKDLKTEDPSPPDHRLLRELPISYRAVKRFPLSGKSRGEVRRIHLYFLFARTRKRKSFKLPAHLRRTENAQILSEKGVSAGSDALLRASVSDSIATISDTQFFARNLAVSQGSRILDSRRTHRSFTRRGSSSDSARAPLQR